MSDDVEFDRSEILFLALTRPALFWGVPFEAAMLNGMGAFIAGIVFNSPTSILRSPFVIWLAAVPIHFVLRWATSFDYLLFRTMWLWCLTGGVGLKAFIAYPTTPPKSPAEIPSCV